VPDEPLPDPPESDELVVLDEPESDEFDESEDELVVLAGVVDEELPRLSFL
jgi:hypothetical protein